MFALCEAELRRKLREVAEVGNGQHGSQACSLWKGYNMSNTAGGLGSGMSWQVGSTATRRPGFLAKPDLHESLSRPFASTSWQKMTKMSRCLVHPGAWAQAPMRTLASDQPGMKRLESCRRMTMTVRTSLCHHESIATWRVCLHCSFKPFCLVFRHSRIPLLYLPCFHWTRYFIHFLFHGRGISTSATPTSLPSQQCCEIIARTDIIHDTAWYRMILHHIASYCVVLHQIHHITVHHSTGTVTLQRCVASPVTLPTGWHWGTCSQLMEPFRCRPAHQHSKGNKKW